MKIGSPEHKAWQEENGRKLQERLQQEVNAGPKGDGMFDRLSYNFASNLLHSINTRKVKK